MRRAAVIVPLALAALWVAAPAQAFAHNAVHHPTLHAVLDGLTLLVATAPVWTAFLWGDARKWWLITLIVVVQVPVALIGFVPLANPYVHLTLFVLVLALTAVSLWVGRAQPLAARRTDLQVND